MNTYMAMNDRLTKKYEASILNKTHAIKQLMSGYGKLAQTQEYMILVPRVRARANRDNFYYQV